MAPRFTVRYLGVWDTVGALGAPAILPLSKVLNREHAFHDVGLTPFVESARHAVAIDERRSLFPPEPWGDLTALNAGKGVAVDHPDAPYQEKWYCVPGGSNQGALFSRRGRIGVSERGRPWISTWST